MSVVPIRCYTCLKVTGNLFDIFRHMTHTMSGREAYAEIERRTGKKLRNCCKRMLISCLDMTERQLYHEAPRLAHTTIKERRVSKLQEAPCADHNHGDCGEVVETSSSASSE